MLCFSGSELLSSQFSLNILKETAAADVATAADSTAAEAIAAVTAAAATASDSDVASTESNDCGTKTQKLLLFLNHDHCYIRTNSEAASCGLLQDSANFQARIKSQVRSLNSIKKLLAAKESKFNELPSEREAMSSEQEATVAEPSMNTRHYRKGNFGLTCPLCAKMFDNRYKYTLHRSSHYRDKRAFKCEVMS